MVCNALVAGGRRSDAGQQAMRPGRGMLHDRVVQNPSSWTHSLLSCTWLPTTSNQALHNIGGNNTHIVSSSWWWAQKSPKHAEHIISKINHWVASRWFFFSTHMQRCTDKHISSLYFMLFNVLFINCRAMIHINVHKNNGNLVPKSLILKINLVVSFNHCE